MKNAPLNEHRFSEEIWDEVSNNPEWTDEELANPLTLEQILPELAASLSRKIGQRGAQKAPTKQLISLRLDSDVIEKFKATGKGWQSLINERLKQVSPV